MEARGRIVIDAACWHHSPSTSSYTIDVGITSNQMDQLATEALNKRIDLAIRSATLTKHTGHTGHEHLLLETTDGATYTATVLDPDESGCQMTITLAGPMA